MNKIFFSFLYFANYFTIKNVNDDVKRKFNVIQFLTDVSK